jgi:hypothetical protein
MNRARVVFLIVVLLLPATSLLAQSRAEKPNDFTLELGGRCIVYSLSYQRFISEQVGLEIGASMLGGTDVSVIFLSGGARFYLTKKNATPCLAGGIVFVTAGTSAGPFGEDSASGVYFYASPGFEYRTSGGFVFRASVNILIKEGFFVWPGLTLGIAF